MNDPVMKDASSDTRNPSQRSLIVYAIVAVGLALIIRFFIAAPYIVSGSSMEPTFYDLHYLIIDKFSYGVCLSSVPFVHLNGCIPVGDPQRGDVIIFDLPQNTSRALIKRVIGLPGETVVLDGSTVSIINAAHPEGFTLSEPYLSAENLGGSSNMRTTLGADQFFVLGDNRRVSADSRLWGTLPREDIVGRVFLRLFPVTEIGVLPGEARYSN